MSIPFPIDLTQGCNLLFGTHSTISTETDTDSAAIDMLDYDGPVHVIYSTGNVGDGSTVVTVKLVESATSDGAYTAITGATTTMAASATANDNLAGWFNVPNRAQRYVKTRVTTAGGTPSVPIAVMVLGRKKIGGGSGVKTDG